MCISMNIIMSPHDDDWIIGCSSLFLSDKVINAVIYTAPITGVRNSESYSCSQKVGFKAFMNVNGLKSTDIKDILTKIGVKKGDNVFVPAPTDTHPEHTKARIIAELFQEEFGYELVYYTTEMNVWWKSELSKLMSENKKELLNEMCTSQKSLWKYEHKYFLFEGWIHKVRI